MADQASTRRALVDGAVLVGILVVLHIAVSVVWSALSGLPILRLGSVVVGAVTGSWPMLLAFALVTALIALTGWPRRLRFRLAAPSAIVAWFLGQALVAVLEGRPMPDALLWSVFGLLMFVAVALAAGLIAAPVAAAVVARPGEPPPAPPGIAAASIVRAVAVGLAILLTLSLPWQWFRVYFRLFGGSERVASPEQGWQYLLTALAALGLIVVAGVLAVRQGTKVTGTVIGFVVVLLVALVCQVPAGTIWLDPGMGEVEEHEVDPHYVDCAFDASRPGCGG